MKDIWEETIISWVNSLTENTPISKIGQLRFSLKKCLDQVTENLSGRPKNLVDFIHEIFPNYFPADHHIISSDLDSLYAATVLLIFICFSNKPELEVIRQSMCTKLDNTKQIYIAEFLMGIQKHGDVYQLTINNVKNEIFNFVKSHTLQPQTMIGDGFKSGQKSSPDSCHSPLVEFFQTPKRRTVKKELNRHTCMNCDGDRLKKIEELRELLAEEELEKVSLNKQLSTKSQKCLDYENKLKNKIEEIKLMKHEWELESKKNVEDLDKLRDQFNNLMEENNKLEKDFLGLENYVSTLETKLSDVEDDRHKLENQLQLALQRCDELISQVDEMSSLNDDLKSSISSKELELMALQEHLTHFQENQHELSYLDGSMNVTPLEPENMGVVLEKILSERNEENLLLKDSVTELMEEKSNLASKISRLQEELLSKDSEISNLKIMASELDCKLNNFTQTCLELEEVQNELHVASKNLDELTAAHLELNREKANINAVLAEKEVELRESNKNNETLKNDFIKLSEELQKAQKNLEDELKNVSKLTMESEEKHLQLQKSMETLSSVQAEHESAKKCLERVNTDLSKYLGKLGKMLNTELEENSSELFSPCCSIEEKLDKLADLLDLLENHSLETAESRAVLERTCIQLNENISSLKAEVFNLEESKRSSLNQKLALEECLIVAEEKMAQLQNTYSEMIEELKRELHEKSNQISELEKVKELESKHERIRQISQEMKSNVKILRLILSKAPVHGQGDASKELQVIYNSCKEITESASQLSVIDETTHSDYVTVCDDNASSVTASNQSSPESNKDPNLNLEIELEELQQDILTAKKSLMAFLQASIKHFEVLKIKDDLITEMTKEHQSLENRISSLTELNKRLTKQILESKTLPKIETDFKEQELEILREEVESLKNASQILKKKLVDLEKVNEALVKKEKESSDEISMLREKNKAVTNDLQNRVMLQLKQQNACWGIVRSKQNTEIELERSLECKKLLEKTFADIRKKLLKHKSNVALQMAFNSAEQNFFITSQKLLYATYSCLKWTEKNIEHKCLMLGRGEEIGENDPIESNFQEELKSIHEKLKSVLDELIAIKKQAVEIESKCCGLANDNEELSDSLEEIPVANKTFDIIDLDERTFCVKNIIPKIDNCNKIDNKKSTKVWIVSPPSKNKTKPVNETFRKKKAVKGESWVVPLDPKPKPEKSMSKFHSACELSADVPLKFENKSPISKSSSLSSIADVDYSPPCKRDTGISQTTFESAVNDNESNKSPSECSARNIKEKFTSDDTTDRQNFHHKNIKLKESLEIYAPAGDSQKINQEDMGHLNAVALEEKLNLEKKIWKLQKEVIENVKECKHYKFLLQESEEKRKKDKESFGKSNEALRHSITTKYEAQLEHLKNEMKCLYNRELAKHKSEQVKLNNDLKEQNKTYKDHIDDLRNQLWELGEKLLQEQKLKRDAERNLNELKKRYERIAFAADAESKSSHGSDFLNIKDSIPEEDTARALPGRQFPTSIFPTIPTEDEDEVFDNRCLEDMKAGLCQIEGPETRLTELQFRNSLCLPHLKSSYPAETQFHNPKLYREHDLKFGSLQFTQESQSLTDSDHSMTRSLLPDDKCRKKEQTSYKRPGPPTPSKNGGRLSLQSGNLGLSPKNILKECNDISERAKATPGRIRQFFKHYKKDVYSVGGKDENSAPGSPRGKKSKIFRPRKPFGGRDN